MRDKLVCIILLLIIGITTFIIISLNKDSKNNAIATSGQVLSNKKIEWGIKRNNNHEQPDLGANNKKLLEEYDGIAMGNDQDKYVYLTFDEGYEAGYTSKILDILKENNVKAAFFITGHYLNTASDLVQRMIDEGHIVGNHTVNHYSLPEINEEQIKNEINKLHQSVYEKFGYEMTYLRPPKGEFSEETLHICNSMGYTTVMWSFAYDDWDESKQEREEYAVNKILTNLHNGEIMLLHANSKDNCNVLDSIINEIKEQGYEFKSLNEFKK